MCSDRLKIICLYTCTEQSVKLNEYCSRGSKMGIRKKTVVLIFSLFQRVLQRQASLGKRSSLISQTAAPTVTSVQWVTNQRPALCLTANQDFVFSGRLLSPATTLRTAAAAEPSWQQQWPTATTARASWAAATQRPRSEETCHHFADFECC